MSFHFQLEPIEDNPQAKKYVCKKPFEYKGKAQEAKSEQIIENFNEQEFNKTVKDLQYEMMVAVDRSINDFKLKN